jgi:dihydroorotate dehydrogenase
MYKERISPILDKLDSEQMHVAARDLLRWAEYIPGGMKFVEYLGNGGRRFDDVRLRVNIAAPGNGGGIVLDNPLMVGAGWDKTGRAVLGLGYLGFAGVTVGTVLPLPQVGNNKPRQRMIASGVAWNALGFNSPGVGVVRENLSRYRDPRSGFVTAFWANNLPRSNEPLCIGVSVGRNCNVPNSAAAVEHFDVIRYMYHVAAYFEHAISSPNTPDLCTLQEREFLVDILQAGNEAMDRYEHRKPVFVKASPDLSLDAALEMAEVVIENGGTGIIFGNTTADDRIKRKYGGQWCGRGGLSGDDAEFRARSTRLISHVYRETGGAITLIGAGGVKDAATALEKIMAGASALQVVTAIRGEGPRVASNINRGIAAFMDANGVRHIKDLVGAAGNLV